MCRCLKAAAVGPFPLLIPHPYLRMQMDYMRHVNAMTAAQQTRLMLSIDELRSFDAELTRKCVRPA